MINWIADNYVNILIVAALLLFVGIILRSMIKNKKHGSSCSSCGEGCHACSLCGQQGTSKEK